MTVQEGTPAFSAFLENPVPVTTKFYFFDMTNPRYMFHNQEKPVLQERGPYTFRFSVPNNNEQSQICLNKGIPEEG